MMTGFSFLCDILCGSLLFLCISVAIAAHAPGLAFSANAEIMNWLWSSQSITINIIHFNAVIPHTHGQWFRHTYLRKKHRIHINPHINKHGYEECLCVDVCSTETKFQCLDYLSSRSYCRAPVWTTSSGTCQQRSVCSSEGAFGYSCSKENRAS